MKLKKSLLFAFYLLAGIILGSMLGNLCSGIGALSWLSYSNSIGFAPTTLDLSVLTLTFGFSMGISVAQIITIATAIFLYYKTVGR